MIPEKINMFSRPMKLKKIILAAGLLLLSAVVGYAADFETGYEQDLAALRSRFESIRSSRQIDAFIEALDRFEKLYPDGKDAKELEAVRSYVIQVKHGLPLKLIISRVVTTLGLDTASENDVIIDFSGPADGKCDTRQSIDNDSPKFKFPIDFTWTVNSKPFVFAINDDDATNVERIGTLIVPCGGITGWRRLHKKRIDGANAVMFTYVINPPDCPW